MVVYLSINYYYLYCEENTNYKVLVQVFDYSSFSWSITRGYLFSTRPAAVGENVKMWPEPCAGAWVAIETFD